MTTQSMLTPLPTLMGLDGKPLTDGSVYIGQANLDPRSFPSSVYFDAALTIPATQPLKTTAGYIHRNGSPTNIWLDDGLHSMLVLDEKGRQVFYAPSWTGSMDTAIRNVTVNRFSGTGAPATYTLTVTPASSAALDVYVNGIYQQKNTYTLSGADLLITAPSGSTNIEAVISSVEDFTAVSSTLAGYVATADASADAAAISETNAAASENAAAASATAAAASATAADASADAAALSESQAAAIVLGNFLQAGTGATSRTFSDKDRERYTARDFGAVVDDSTDDASKVQAAHDAAGTRYTIDLGNGVYRVKPTSSSPYYMGNLTGNLVYRAVAVTKSDFTFKGGRFHIVSRSGVIAADVQPAFATAKSTTIGTVENVEFDGVEVNTENDADATNSNQRGMYMVGVRGLRLKNTRGISTGTRRGYFAHIQNCDNVQITGHYHRKVTGGFNFRYCTGVIMADCVFDDFSEAIDFDGTSTNAVLSNLIFRGTARTSQCIDINGQVGLKASNITVDTVGNIATIQYKDTTPPNYSDYINNVTPSSLTPSKDVTIRAVRGSAVGSSSLASIIVGNDWSGIPHDGYDPVSNIALEDVQLTDTSYVIAFEGRNVLLRNFHIKDVIVPSGYAAIDMRSVTDTDAKLTWSDLTARLENVSVEESDYGSVKFSDARRVVIHGLRVRRSNQVSGTDPDLRITSMHTRGTEASVDGLDLDGSVTINGDSTAISAWAISTAYPKNKLVTNSGKFYRCTTAGTSAGAGGPTTTSSAITDGTCVWEYMEQPYRVTWGPNNIVRGTLTLQGDAQKYIHGRSVPLSLGDIAATGTVSRVAFVAKRRCLIARVTYAVSAAVTANASNYRAATVKSIQDGGAAQLVCQVATNVTGWSAYTGVDGGTVNYTRALLNPGDTAYIDLTSAGTGVAFTGLVATLEVLDC